MDYTRPTPPNPNTPEGFFTTGPGTDDGLSTPGIEGGTGLDPADFSPGKEKSSPEAPSSDSTLGASGNSLPEQVEAFFPPDIPGRNETRPVLGQIEPLEPNSESSQSGKSPITTQSAIVAAEKKTQAFMRGQGQSPDPSEFYKGAPRGKAA